MMGSSCLVYKTVTIQKTIFFKEECIEFNYKWLAEELAIDINEIDILEDVRVREGNLVQQ
jgi:alanyl-tRNA synthetase